MRMTMSPSPYDSALSELRSEIDSLDDRLLELMAHRFERVRRVGDLKQEAGTPAIRDPRREAELHDAWAKKAEERGLAPYLAGRILRELTNWSRRSQERSDSASPSSKRASTRVSFQGARHAHSDLAARKLFASRGGAELDAIPYANFAEAMAALERGEVDYALLPFENSLVGSVPEVGRLISKGACHIVDEEIWEVEHVVAVPPGLAMEDIVAVRSHPVALAQCRRFFEANPSIAVEEWFDTAGAAESIAAHPDGRRAALCSVEAARAHGLEVLVTGVGDRRRNLTRFLLMAREPETPAEGIPATTTLHLKLSHAKGSLHGLLGVFEGQGLNLSRIESRANPDRAFEYSFLIDIETRLDAPEMQGALNEARRHAVSIDILGTYPCRGERAGSPECPAALSDSLGAIARPKPEPASQGAVVPAEAKAVARDEMTTRRSVRVGGVEIGPDQFTLIAGPCAVESEAQLNATAEIVKARGAAILRGGAFKPRTSPHSFQGLRWEGVKLLKETSSRYDIPFVTEVIEPGDVERLAEEADMLQVGARNMQNFPLLRALGRVRTPVLLKRGMSATLDELLLATEYLFAGGNDQVVLCERGIRTFERSTRATLDVSAVPVLKEKCGLPVIVDPSHAAGRRDLVVPLALAAAAAGADGLIVEVHHRPEEALCDKDQALRSEDLDALVAGLQRIQT